MLLQFCFLFFLLSSKSMFIFLVDEQEREKERKKRWLIVVSQTQRIVCIWLFRFEQKPGKIKRKFVQINIERNNNNNPDLWRNTEPNSIFDGLKWISRNSNDNDGVTPLIASFSPSQNACQFSLVKIIIFSVCFFNSRVVRIYTLSEYIVIQSNQIKSIKWRIRTILFPDFFENTWDNCRYRKKNFTKEKKIRSQKKHEIFL